MRSKADLTMTNIIFDYDGTLHNCLKIYKPAFIKACDWLMENGYPVKDSYSDSEIGYWLGFNSSDMWSMFQPELPPEKREICRKIIGAEMELQVRNGNAELFPGAENMLGKLKEMGCTLIFLSNCRVRYWQRHNSVFGLDRWFDYFYCAEEFDFIPKYEIFRLIRPQHKGDFIVIGDRFHDIETASINNLKSIGCAYGYGSPQELEKADIIVDNISEIPSAVEQLI